MTQAHQPQITAGPFQIIGQVFGMIGNVVNLGNTVISTADRSATRLSNQVDKGFDALDLVIDSAVEEFATDNLVADAKRKVRLSEAQAEADIIIADLAKAVANK